MRSVRTQKHDFCWTRSQRTVRWCRIGECQAVRHNPQLRCLRQIWLVVVQSACGLSCRRPFWGHRLQPMCNQRSVAQLASLILGRSLNRRFHQVFRRGPHGVNQEVSGRFFDRRNRCAYSRPSARADTKQRGRRRHRSQWGWGCASNFASAQTQVEKLLASPRPEGVRKCFYRRAGCLQSQSRYRLWFRWAATPRR